MLKSVKKHQFLLVRGTSGLGLTARGRVMQSPIDQLVSFTPPNKYKDIFLIHTAGPMKGIRIKFKLAIARKARIQDVCLCEAYTYPHRKGTGQCEKKH